MRIKLAVFLALALPLGAVNRWKMQFFYDKDASALEIRDLQCPSITNCVAAAVVSEQNKEKPKGTLVLTSDGGAHWSYVDTKELPYSLFFLNANSGWMVTDKGLWKTGDAARTWTKTKGIKGMKGIERVWFVSESHGWAVGQPKAIFETQDGGNEWTKLPVASTVNAPNEEVVYDSILFSKQNHAIIGGRTGTSALLIESKDGGKTWTSTESKVRGQFNRIQYLDNTLLGVVEYFGKTKTPSEIYQLDTAQKTAAPVFNRTGMVARDVAVLPDKEVIVAAIEVMGTANQVPIPGKLKMLQSTSLETWVEDKVDYRAVAMHPVIAAADSNHVWIATDTGMILKREVVD